MSEGTTRIVYVAACSQERAEEAASRSECHFRTAEDARREADSYTQWGRKPRLRVYKAILRVHVESVVYHDRRKPPKEKSNGVG